MNRKIVPAFLCLGFFVVSNTLFAQQAPVRIRAIDEVIRQWRADQHLYVRGDLGVAPDQLSRLESWLDENGTNWTVVLLETAEGSYYETTDRRTYRDLDAVEYALGHGLANRTRFGELEDSRTGETNGAVFVLFLQERKFSYYGSDAQDRRSLGESKWVGDLDAPAIRAMKSGGRIIDAVKDTVTSINTKLDQAIVMEVAEAERARRERQRAMTELRAKLADTQKKTQQVSELASQVKIQFPNASGELTQPPVEEWQTQLTAISTAATETNVRAMSQKLGDVEDQIEGFLNAYAEFKEFDAALEPLTKRISQLKSDRSGAAAQSIAQATAAIEEAKAAHARGERQFSQRMLGATKALDDGQQAIAAEQERQRQAAARRKLIRNTAAATSGVLLLALGAVLYSFNRRRLPVKGNAVNEFARLDASVKSEMDTVLRLFTRSNEVLGSKERVEQRGYVGDTHKMSQDTFQNVDDLLVMSNEVERVMNEAKELIHPPGLLGKIVNLFSSSRYLKGVNRMSGEPLRFTRDRGLPLAITADDATPPGVEPPNEISLTFEKVFQAFRDRCGTTTDTLGILENSLMQAHEALAKMLGKTEEVSAIDRQLSEASDRDGLFDIPTLFEKLLPSADVDYDQANAIASTDPVRTVRILLPAGQRKLDDGLHIAQTIDAARREMLPQFDQQAPILKGLGYATDWIQQTLNRLTARANELLLVACDRSVAEDAQKFRQEVTELGERVQQCATLAQQVQNDHEPALRKAKQDVDAARQQVAAALRLPIERALHEQDADPDHFLVSAQEQSAGAKAALQQGNVTSIQEAIQGLQRQLQQTKSITKATLQGLHGFDETLRERRQQYETVQRKLPERERAVETARRTYSRSALSIQAGDPAYPDASATADGQLEKSRQILMQSERSLDEAAAAHRQGEILRAVATFDETRADVQRADQLLDEIAQHCARLESKTRENATALDQLVGHARNLQAQTQERLTTRVTIAEYERALNGVEQAQRQLSESSGTRDPFQDGLLLLSVRQNLQRLDAMLIADRDAHAEAARAVNGAANELANAQRLVNQSQTDGIPDSRLITACISEIQSLGSAVQAVRRDLDAQHGDWQRVDGQAAHLNAELGLQAGRLRGELQRAQQSVAALEQASRDVFQATQWSGGNGIRIQGSPGIDQLERARAALRSGDYGTMVELAQAAASAAQYAIQSALREVERQRLEEARRLEEQRRRQARSSSSGGSSRPWSFPSGGGSSGRSSGGGGSSSGFSRSGW